MKKNIFKSIAIAASALVLTTSCEEALDFGPIDYYGSESYWKSAQHVESFAVGLHSHLRDVYFGHTALFGEMRSGIYRQDVTSDSNVPYYNNVITNVLTQTSPTVTNFYNIFGRITNCNLLLSKLPDLDFMTEDEKAPYYALAYGLRAHYYFQLHKNWGGVPIRLTVDVIEGERDVNVLYMERDKASNVLAQCKTDVAASLEYYGDDYSFNPYGLGADKGYWSRAASEALAADIYLWSGKVTTPFVITQYDGSVVDGTATAIPSDLDIAKTHFNNLLTKYGLALCETQSDIFNIYNKYNSESIFSMRFAEGEYTNNCYNYLYNCVTGATQYKYDQDGNLWGDYLSLNASTSNWYEYDSNLWKAYSPLDKRRDENFVVSYDKFVDADGNEIDLPNTEYYPDGVLTKMWGTHCKKNLGYMNSLNVQIYCGDIPYYRLAWVYLGLAEIANYQGEDAAMESNMKFIRDRAYGAGVNDFVASSDFTENEIAIFQERMFEFVQEGHTWWDLRRMTSTKGGDPLVFSDDPRVGIKGYAVLNKATQSHMILWPVDETLMASDYTITQTPGYEE